MQQRLGYTAGRYEAVQAWLRLPDGRLSLQRYEPVPAHFYVMFMWTHMLCLLLTVSCESMLQCLLCWQKWLAQHAAQLAQHTHIPTTAFCLAYSAGNFLPENTVGLL